MDESRYEVRITGLALSRLPASRIIADCAGLLCLSLPEAEARLASLPSRVRGALTLEQALKYQRVLGRAGLECEIREEAAAGEGAAGALGEQA